MFKYPKEIDFLIYDKIDSTNTEAKRLIKGGFGYDGTVIIANSQTKGYGRKGNKWISPKGNLYLSIIFQQKNVTIEELQHLMLVFSIIVRESVFQLISPNNQNLLFKWPNDVLLNNKKLAGLVVESQFSNDCKSVDWFVLGIGVNIKHCPSNMDFPATSITNEGAYAIETLKLSSKIVRNLEIWSERLEYKGFDYIRKYWLNRAYLYQEEVIIKQDEEIVIGQFEDINDKGEIIIREKNNNIKQLAIGDFFPSIIADVTNPKKLLYNNNVIQF